MKLEDYEDFIGGTEPVASNEAVENEMRQFETGATRNIDTERIDPEGFLAPEPLAEFFNYMHKNRVQKNGNIRESDNWQLGIPQRVYMKSLWRHFFDFWTVHREVGNNKVEPSPYRNEKLIEDCCAMMFNVMGYLKEELKKPAKVNDFDGDHPEFKINWTKALNRKAIQDQNDSTDWGV
jgi:hypothetical protein